MKQFLIILYFTCFFNSIQFPPAYAQNIPTERAVNAIIGESEDSNVGMLAIACAIRNRGTLKGVYGEHAPRVKQKKYSKKVYQYALRAWHESAKKDITNGADHWASARVDKAWALKMQKAGYKFCGQFGGNLFYKAK